MSERQRAFCRYVVEGCSQTEAYIKAGYSRRGADAHAARLVVNGRVAAEIERLRKAAEDAAIADRRERMVTLTRIMRDNMLAVDGTKNDPKLAISAIQELNKMDGAYKPEERKVELTGTLGVGAVLTALGLGGTEPLAK